jgi:hypothetical protein
MANRLSRIEIDQSCLSYLFNPEILEFIQPFLFQAFLHEHRSPRMSPFTRTVLILGTKDSYQAKFIEESTPA